MEAPHTEGVDVGSVGLLEHVLEEDSRPPTEQGVRTHNEDNGPVHPPDREAQAPHQPQEQTEISRVRPCAEKLAIFVQIGSAYFEHYFCQYGKPPAQCRADTWGHRRQGEVHQRGILSRKSSITSPNMYTTYYSVRLHDLAFKWETPTRTCSVWS